MLGHHADDFVGGTVYQAFLDAFSYHRWHAPVKGRIAEAKVVPGTYFAEAIAEGLDPAGPNLSQGYIAHLATRAIIIFETRRIGRVAMVQIGMADCSSCQLKKEDESSLEKGDRIGKGRQVGYFLFGGSSYCLVFQKDVIESFEVDAIPGVLIDPPPRRKVEDLKKERWPLWVNSKIATARLEKA